MGQDNEKIVPMRKGKRASQGNGNQYYAHQFLILMRAVADATETALKDVGAFTKKSVAEDDCSRAIASLAILSDALVKAANFYNGNVPFEIELLKYSAMIPIYHAKSEVDNTSEEIEVLTWIPENRFQQQINQRRTIKHKIDRMKTALSDLLSQTDKFSREIASARPITG